MIHSCILCRLSQFIAQRYNHQLLTRQGMKDQAISLRISPRSLPLTRTILVCTVLSCMQLLPNAQQTEMLACP